MSQPRTITFMMQSMSQASLVVSDEELERRFGTQNLEDVPSEEFAALVEDYLDDVVIENIMDTPRLDVSYVSTL